MLKLKFQCFGHLMQRADLLEKTLMLAETEGRRRRGWQRMKWLDSITDSWTWIWANLGKRWRTGEPGMLQSMALQRVGHNLATEQQQCRAKCKTREKWRIIHRGCESRKTGHWLKENPWQKLQRWKEYHNEITENSNRSWSTPSNSILFFWLALLCLFPYFQQGVLHTFSKTLDREELRSSDVTETILSVLFNNIKKASLPAKGNSSHMFSQPRPSCS